MITLDTLNLDGENAEDLDTFADHNDVTDPELRAQQALEFGVDEATMETLVDYARTKARAMRFRLSGNILRAGLEESRCETIYSQLPEAIRW